MLRVVVSASRSGSGAAVAAVVLADRGRVLRSFVGVRADEDPAGAAMWAALRILWTSRGSGKTVVMYIDPPEVADWLARRAPVPDRHLATYVQIRAISHAYRHVEFLPAGAEELDLVRKVVQGRPGGERPGGANVPEPVGRA